MKDAVRQAEGQRDTERVEDWEKNHQLWKTKMKRRCGRALWPSTWKSNRDQTSEISQKQGQWGCNNETQHAKQTCCTAIYSLKRKHTHTQNPVIIIQITFKHAILFSNFRPHLLSESDAETWADTESDLNSRWQLILFFFFLCTAIHPFL